MINPESTCRPAAAYFAGLLLGTVWIGTMAAVWFIALSIVFGEAHASDADRYRSDLLRISHAEAGLDAPVAVFAAQIHQESGWNPQAVSKVGARGMAQFMPATAKWWCDLIGQDAKDCQPANPTWAMRSLVGYDVWLYDRVRGESEFDRWWAALRAYNGGLGHWQAEAALVRPLKGRESIDAACGKAKRHISFCRENLGYPLRIMKVLQPLYRGWGRGVFE
jgi:soluble lytic murein transglycosylase-like protein